MNKRFGVGGMSCSNCSAGIEKAVSKLNGINKVSVSLVSKEMSVDFDEQKISEQIIIATVKRLGYSISDLSDKNSDKNNQANQLKKRFFISLSILIPLMYLCLGKAVGLPCPQAKINFSIQFFLALAILIINRKFFINGIKAVINKMPNMDTLVALGSSSAFIYSLTMTILLLTNKAQVHHVFFDSSAMILSLITLGKWLEEISKVKTGDAVLKLAKLIPDTATILEDGQEKVILTNQAKIGDVLILRAGDYVSVDGVIVDGSATIDKSAITGESMPEEIKKGDAISSGTILKNGYLLVQAQKVGNETLFSQIIEIVKSAGASKAPIQKYADKVAGIFVPIVVGISILTFIVWIILTKDLYKSFNFAISVLVVSCPCSLGLATPVAVMAGTGKGASKGILFKDASSLQDACKINCILLDKTATITAGKPKVIDFINFSDDDQKEIFSLVSALEQKSTHPLSESIIEFCGKSALSVQEFEYIIGKGMVGEIYGIKYYLGNKEILPKDIIIDHDLSQYQDKTITFFADDDRLICIFIISDFIKEDSIEAIKKLKDKNIKLVMLTGDNEGTAKSIANQVGLDEFYAKVLPQDKFEYVKKYQAKGYKVAMVGDGINDSPALKGADIGIAIGTGTDIAIDSADIVLANGSLNGLSESIDISCKTLKIIKQNLFWAFFYNSIGIPIAAGVLSFMNIVLSPIIASALMSCSSLFVVTNALRIRAKEKEKIKEEKKKGQLIKSKLIIEGMTCNHCVDKVRNALLSLEKVYDIKIDLNKKTATLNREDSIAIEDVINKIEQAGFEISQID